MVRIEFIITKMKGTETVLAAKKSHRYNVQKRTGKTMVNPVQYLKLLLMKTNFYLVMYQESKGVPKIMNA
jgi:hypothetical protein